jgi:Arc/MetJ family transcription regulator
MHNHMHEDNTQIDPDLLREAMDAVGVEEKTKAVHLGLRALLQEAARKRLATLRGTIKRARAPQRRKLK